MEDYTKDPLHMNESGFIDAVYLFVWGNDDPCTEEYSFSHTIKELKTQFRRVSEAEQFVADLAVHYGKKIDDFQIGDTPFSSDQEKTFMKMINNIFDSKEES